MLRTVKIGIGIFYKILLAAAILATGIGLVRYTSQTMETAGKAAAMCMEVILPSLFPFLVISNLMIGLGYTDMIGRFAAPLMRKLFRVSGACAGVFIMGIVGGYPVGARAAISSYERGLCTRTECERLLSFCNNSGPAFILGVVGAGVFSNSRAGMLLYLSHVLASVTVGLCFRFYKWREPQSAMPPPRRTREKPAQVFVNAVRSGLVSIGSISAFVIFFAVAVNLLFASGALQFLARQLAEILSPFGMDSKSAERILVGILEMTSGLTSLQGAAESMNAKLSMAAFLLGWAGVSVHCQVLSFIGDSGLSLLPYLGGKFLHAVLSAVYMGIIVKWIPLSISTSTIAAGQVEFLTGMNLSGFLAGTLLNCAAVGLSFFLLWIWNKISNKVC